MKREWTILKAPSDDLDRSAPYDVPDEQLVQFGRLTPLQRLSWLDEARLFTLKAALPIQRTRKAKHG